MFSGCNFHQESAHLLLLLRLLCRKIKYENNNKCNVLMAHPVLANVNLHFFINTQYLLLSLVDFQCPTNNKTRKE